MRAKITDKEMLDYLQRSKQGLYFSGGGVVFETAGEFKGGIRNALRAAIRAELRVKSKQGARKK